MKAQEFREGIFIFKFLYAWLRSFYPDKNGL